MSCSIALRILLYAYMTWHIKLGMIGASFTIADGSIRCMNARQVSFFGWGLNECNVFDLLQVIVVKDFTNLSSHIPTDKYVAQNEHLCGLTFPNVKRKFVDLLIVIGESELHDTTATHKATSGKLWASHTGICWVLHGRDMQTMASSPSVVCEIETKCNEVSKILHIGFQYQSC